MFSSDASLIAEVNYETRYRQLRCLNDNELICAALSEAPSEARPYIRALTERVEELKLALHRANLDIAMYRTDQY